MSKRLAGWSVVLGLTCAMAAFAADDKQGDFTVALRGGISGYTGDLNELSAAGPAWGVGVGIQPTNLIGVEFAYEGSKNEITDLRLIEGPSLQRHGASALVKLGLPFIERVKPFVGAGLGLSRVGVAGDSNGLYRSDLMEEIPLAVGIEVNSGILTAGVRATYRFLFDEDYASPARPGNPGGGLFDAVASVGGRF
jgi:opacity protein-like surface antigen